MSAPVGNGVPRRATTVYRHGETGTELQVHKVTEDSQGEVNTVGGVREVRPGDILVSTSRPDQWDVYDEKTFGDMDYHEDSDTAPVEPTGTDNDDADEDEERFDPSTVTAAEVRDFLARDDVSDEEKARVRREERDGLNRQSALR